MLCISACPQGIFLILKLERYSTEDEEKEQKSIPCIEDFFFELGVRILDLDGDCPHLYPHHPHHILHLPGSIRPPGPWPSLHLQPNQDLRLKKWCWPLHFHQN